MNDRQRAALGYLSGGGVTSEELLRRLTGEGLVAGRRTGPRNIGWKAHRVMQSLETMGLARRASREIRELMNLRGDPSAWTWYITEAGVKALAAERKGGAK